MSIPGLQSKTLMNRSSLKTNIITGEQNEYSGHIKPKLMDREIFNRKKGITEIRDLMGPNSKNRNPDYVNAWDQNSSMFKR